MVRKFFRLGLLFSLISLLTLTSLAHGALYYLTKNPLLTTPTNYSVSETQTDQAWTFNKWTFNWIFWHKTTGQVWSEKYLGSMDWVVSGGQIYLRVKAPYGWTDINKIEYGRFKQDEGTTGYFRLGDYWGLNPRLQWSINLAVLISSFPSSVTNGLTDLWWRLPDGRKICVDFAWYPQGGSHWVDRNNNFHCWWALSAAPIGTWVSYNIYLPDAMTQVEYVAETKFNWYFDSKDCIFHWHDLGIEIFPLLAVLGTEKATVVADYLYISYAYAGCPSPDKPILYVFYNNSFVELGNIDLPSEPDGLCNFQIPIDKVAGEKLMLRIRSEELAQLDRVVLLGLKIEDENGG